MGLKLTRPLVFFDIESTGIDVATDRIIEICFLKLNPDGTKEIKTRRVNPEMPIPKEATAIHGITDEDVEDEPTFAKLAKSMAAWLDKCDFAGYNSNRFDVPLLVEEFHRAGVNIEIEKRQLIDVQNIFHKKEQRTLEAAYRFYCDKTLENAHSAEADTVATYEVLVGQLERYDDLEKNVKFLAEFSAMNDNVDLAGRVIRNSEGTPIFNFGKHKGRSVVEVFEEEPSYYAWMMDSNFPQNTKNVITEIRLKSINK